MSYPKWLFDPTMSRCKCDGKTYQGWLFADETSRLDLGLGRLVVKCDQCGKRYVIMGGCEKCHS